MMMHSLTFQAHHGEVCTHVVVWFDLNAVFGRHMALIWMSHGTHVNESWHTYEWVMAHIWTSHGAHMNVSWRTYQRVMAHIWMWHGTRMNESWHTYEWAMAHINIWMSHGTYMNASALLHAPCCFCTQFLYKCVSIRVWVWVFFCVCDCVWVCVYFCLSICVCVNTIIYI